jgi:hypothetical protein
MFCEFVDKERQICCTESFLNLFLKLTAINSKFKVTKKMVPEISIPRLYYTIMEKIRFNTHEQTRTVGVLAFGSDAQLP